MEEMKEISGLTRARDILVGVFVRVGQNSVCAVDALLFPESRKLSENRANCTE